MTKPKPRRTSPRKKSTSAKRAVPDPRRYALLIIDMLNEFDFPEGKALMRRSLPVAKAIRRLKTAMTEKGLPVIYVNDNFGRWKSDRREVIDRCMRDGCLGAAIAQILLPGENDYFVLKPKHSAFFSTTLETLLSHLDVDGVILTGVAGNMCVLHTAFDAHVRDFAVAIPNDGVACNTDRDRTWVLHEFKVALHAETRNTSAWVRTLNRSRARKGRRAVAKAPA